MTMLTVIIPFLNEGVEVYNTVKSIRDTSDIDLNIILINDASTDGYDYRSVATEFNAQYIVHSARKGVAASRDEGVDLCITEYFMLLDAHMRFYQTDWSQIIIEELDKDHRVLLCCSTVGLYKDADGITYKKNMTFSYGAYFYNDDSRSYVSRWNYYDPSPNESVIDIACVLGASYATNKRYWSYIRGLEGLRSYGRDEELISLKVWLEGGRCRLIKNITVGHIYRKSMPYEYIHADLVYNILYIAELLYDEDSRINTYQKLEIIDPLIMEQALLTLKHNEDLINDQKEYYKKIFNRDIRQIIRYNNLLEDINKLYDKSISRFALSKGVKI